MTHFLRSRERSVCEKLMIDCRASMSIDLHDRYCAIQFLRSFADSIPLAIVRRLLPNLSTFLASRPRRRALLTLLRVVLVRHRVRIV